jgi:adenine-specific DNA-methyltransferase
VARGGFGLVFEVLRPGPGHEPPQEEVLVDRPEVESGIVRVSGPFVVEATIPTAIEVEPPRTVKDRDATYETDPISRMIEVLRRSPTLRLAGNQTVTLKNIRRPAKAMDLHAEAEMAEPTPTPVAFIFGPEHGPVIEQMVFSAAKEAHLKNYAHLFVVGCHPAWRKQAHPELRTGRGSTGDIRPGHYGPCDDGPPQDNPGEPGLSVTGAPDVQLIRLKRKNGNGLCTAWSYLAWMFDPVTMQNDHRKGVDVPAWFLDTEYDDLVFHESGLLPAHQRLGQPQEGLKGPMRILYEHLAGTVSEPFSAGDHKKIAVKVIDDRGNELMVVKSLDEAELSDSFGVLQTTSDQRSVVCSLVPS